MAKAKNRENTPDVMPRAAGTVASAPAPGELPPGKIGVFNASGQRVGHMGRMAGAPTASRFLKGAPAKLGKVDGQDAWVAAGPTSGRNSPGTKRAAQLAQAKGSVTKNLTAPQTSARPKR